MMVLENISKNTITITIIKIKINKMSKEISYTTRTFYVPAEKIDTLVAFQGK